MKYVSTRGDAPVLDFGEALLTGLAIDGGLYVPTELPRFTDEQLRGWRDRPYAEVATGVLADLVAPAIERDELAELVSAAYAGFDDPDIVPLRPLGDGEWLLELFHGPTLSFKDVALQLVGVLFERQLARTGRTVTIVGATSGDTGSAAIEAMRDREGIELVMLHPSGRVSEIQRLQMTTVDAPNITNVAVEGTFDDCQDLVKALFADRALRDEVGLAAVNSINIARVLAQSVYYVTSALALGAPERRVAYTVPTGNFGNVYSGHLARERGLPLERFTVATNRNDILARFLLDGEMRIEAVEPSLSPAMDIQVSSNFERLLWEVLGRDGAAVAEALVEFRRTGRLPVDGAVVEAVRVGFGGGRRSDEQILATIAEVHDAHGVVVDPHTAVGIGVGRAVERDPDVAHVMLACAHPAKFGAAVERAVGRPPELPPRLADLADRPERYLTVDDDLDTVRDIVRRQST
ncbi:MAG: threonine synthase [Actinomycetota bacterium]